MKKLLFVALLLSSCHTEHRRFESDMYGEPHEFIEESYGNVHPDDCRFCNTDNPEGNPE